MSSAIEKLSCKGCGAPLPRRKTSRTIVCEYCSSTLQFALDPGPETAKDVVNLRKTLKDLDLAWERYKRSVGTPDGTGNYDPPDENTALGYAVIGGLGTLVATVLFGAFTLWFIPIPLVVGFFITRHHYLFELLRARAYAASGKLYADRRAELVTRLAGLEGKIAVAS
ncbi:hypothetical protein OJ996_18805 [Luteolibacter sp. GHJ8]|uniref:DUF983 domain-containing protein n=1 Tax=Luteolibacter rhizosphaerae TaxID=2989719 RepID=A0ABT3G715_9BACT|nr:hypothetical protein [Luteolibacter rhizosphaerae]MCW1915643.1 hypothetical protein [Luteolibacter rhizosphaerae]